MGECGKPSVPHNLWSIYALICSEVVVQGSSVGYIGGGQS